MKKIIVFLMAILLVAMTGCAYKPKAVINRCMNIGNALEAPRDMPWDVQMDDSYFDIIKKSGFDSVRLPVRFSDYVMNEKNYTLDEAFMAKIDGYVNTALDCKLTLILDFHHFTEIMENPDNYQDSFLRIWEQLALRYKDYPSQLVFELLNEPNGQLGGEKWNNLIAQAVKVIRKTNPQRLLIVGPDHYYSLDHLNDLSLPKDDNLMVSFHYYEPNEFTFQGNPYLGKYENLHDIHWNSTQQEQQYLESRFDKVKSWAKEHGVQVFLGEFGANQLAPAQSRSLWTAAVRKQAESCGFGWGYWELCSSFGIYNTKSKQWDQEMLKALLE